MEWLGSLVSSALEGMGVDTASKMGASLEFFIYDTAKILILLTSLIFVISYVSSYFPPERTKRILGGHRGIPANVLGALLGTVTPFCSCSSIPIFIGFTKAGLPLGVAFSFLISSPFVDLAALIILTSIFGVEIAAVYVMLGILLAVVGGTLMDRLHMEDQIAEFARPSSDGSGPSSGERCSCGAKSGIADDMTFGKRSRYSLEQVRSTVSRVWIYIIAGVTIGALIHNWIPGDTIESVLGGGNPFSVFIATMIGVPIYADIFGTIPIAEALYSKGVGAGTILAFMMGVTATSIPSIAMLKGVCGTKLLAIFFGIVVVGIVAMGYAFNTIQSLL